MMITTLRTATHEVTSQRTEKGPEMSELSETVLDLKKIITIKKRKQK